ncbi:MaoC/PaaZ C-terminal domain-containing protein [Minwuia sp.]|uniref:MaoC/PaaZ C-terminal domain-containing protein n=1 Tax=Minwuia sp. TaxID=2493630 RepID=UPI003A92CE1F
MRISSARTGEKLGTIVTELTPRRMLAFAAGLELGDDCYLDDARPGGVAMMPAMCAAIEWPLADGNRLSELMGITLAQYRSVGVHAEQDSLYHRPPRMGETLTTTGWLETLRQTRAGVLMTCRYDTVDADGAAVFTSYNSGMLRGWELDCAEAGSSDRQDLGKAVPVGGDMQADDVTIARHLPHIYSEGGPIWNPIHTERRVALAANLPDIILHGSATWALAMDRVIRARCGGDPDRLKRFACRFSGMVIPGETITVRHRPDGTFDCVNAGDRAVLSSGIAEFHSA